METWEKKKSGLLFLNSTPRIEVVLQKNVDTSIQLYLKEKGNDEVQGKLSWNNWPGDKGSSFTLVTCQCMAGYFPCPSYQ